MPAVHWKQRQPVPPRSSCHFPQGPLNMACLRLHKPHASEPSPAAARNSSAGHTRPQAGPGRSRRIQGSQPAWDSNNLTRSRGGASSSDCNSDARPDSPDRGRGDPPGTAADDKSAADSMPALGHGRPCAVTDAPLLSRPLLILAPCSRGSYLGTPILVLSLHI